ncbi:acetyl-CoA acetyltransferase [Desulfosporosinus orientis DSM 765]|uniref:acetyl-CoA C-acetyltransferase n=1 Tax=Desulfosporosinus orientis (strain ATCC 19365 / DSM 765 / NCIMB 8382 / VKM B-1628 / Singapore I) TaxID=768706 RepID=G7WGR6_DESOD|nr:thiolase family protein [Desulfosporosinus orientis]AET68502.1 acetyl-CoA acetyltransferase [Desulfosporosinus orientis DSM 765]
MQEVVIVGAARTPFGLYKGSLADQRSQDLAACSMKEAVARAGIDSLKLDVSIYSEAMQTSLPANVGRHGWLLAGLDENPAGFTMNALCAGALQTIVSGFNKIASGEYQGILAGGVETNSQAPYYIHHPRYHFGSNNLCFHDQKAEVETNAQPVDIYGKLAAANVADIIAVNNGITRYELDMYTQTSKEKASQAVKNGFMKDAITIITKKGKKSEVIVEADEGLKAFSDIDKLISLPAINSGGTSTKGNLAPLADGSASIVLLSSQRTGELGCKAMARVLGFGIAAGNPTQIEKIAIKSMQKALNYAGIRMDELDFIDLHEHSAAFSVAVAKMIGASAAGITNVDGGSLAYGHAGAATGGAMLVNMLYRLQRNGARYGLVNVAAYGGQSLSVLIEAIL